MSYDHRNDYAEPNEYNFANPFEEQPQRATSGSSPPGEPPSVPKLPVTSFQPRALQPPVLYIPRLGEGRRAQRRADRQIAALRIASTVAVATADFEVVLAKAEAARQQREMVEQRRMQLPVKIEFENLQLGKEVLQARDEFAGLVRHLKDADEDHRRNRQIKAVQFETALHQSIAERLAAEVREKEAEAYLARAAEIGNRKAEADFYKATQSANEREANAEAELRRRDQERVKRAEGVSEMPEPLARHYATERKVQESQKNAQERIVAIRRRAQAENRELTDNEIEEIDALKDAAAGAEDTIRRGDGTDFEV